MVWLGEHVAGALAELGVGGVAVHRGAMACSSWCPLVCFAGLGPGEVLRDGGKLVGISQRRTRAGSRFQCAVHERWSPERLVALLAGDLPRRRPAAGGHVAGAGGPGPPARRGRRPLPLMR